MPTVDQYRSQATLTTARATPQVSVSEAANLGAEGVKKTTKAVETFADVMGRVVDFQETTQAQNIANEKLKDIQLRANADPDPKGYERYLKEIDEAGKEASSTISNGMARMKFQADHDASASQVKFTVQQNFWKKQLQAAHADTMKYVEDKKSEYWSQPVDALKKQTMSDMISKIDELQASKAISQEEAMKWKLDIQNDLPYGQAIHDATIDPERTKNLIQHGFYKISDPDKVKDAMEFSEKRIEKARKDAEDAIKRHNAKVKAEQLASGDGFTLKEYEDALKQGVYKSPDEAAKFRDIAINGISSTASTDGDTYIALSNEFFSLGTPDKNRKNITATTKTADDIQAFRLKVRDANKMGRLSTTDMQQLIDGTQAIFDKKVGEDVGNKKTAWQKFSDWITPWSDAYQGERNDAKQRYTNEFMNRVVVNGEEANSVVSDIQWKAAWEQFPQFSGKKTGDTYTNPSGVQFEVHGLTKDGKPALRRKK